MDLFHVWGEDLRLGATGDLLMVDGQEKGRQRIIRRLLSNAATEDAPGDLIFEPAYGAGLPRRIGSTDTPARLQSVVRHQLFMEAAVNQEPPPDIRVTPIFGGASIRVLYADSETGETMSAGFAVER